MEMIDRSFPLIDLHRHLDGSVRLQTILDLGRQHNLPLPADTLEGMRPYVQVTEPTPSVMTFIAKFEWMSRVLVDYEACRRIAYENVEDAQREGIDYIELRFSPWFMAESNQLDPAGVVEAVADGVEAGVRDFDTHVNLIGILSRTYGVDIAWKELDALLRYRDRIVALDLAGDEIHYPRSGLLNTLSVGAMRDGTLRSMPEKPWDLKACGMRSGIWARPGLGMGCAQLKIRHSWIIWPNTKLALNPA